MKKYLKFMIPITLLSVMVGIYIAFENSAKATDVNKVTFIAEVVDKGETTQLGTVEFLVENEITVGDVIDAINGDVLTFDLKGEKDSEYGRFIHGINDIFVEDSVNGPWWFYDSNTNSECVAVGFCSGIDQQIIAQDDVYIFTITYE